MQVPMENWVLCRIFLKRRGGVKNGEEEHSFNNISLKAGRVVFYDFLAQNKINPASSSSSSATSGITDNNESDESSTSNILTR